MNKCSTFMIWTGWLTFISIFVRLEARGDFSFSDPDHYLTSVVPDGDGMYDCSNQNFLKSLKGNSPRSCLFCYVKSDTGIRNGTCANFKSGCDRKCCQGVVSAVYVPSVFDTFSIVTSCVCGACPAESEVRDSNSLYYWIPLLN